MTTVHVEPTLAVERAAPSRAEVEDFLYLEAELLDDWRLDDWLSLFEPGGTYRMPATDAPDSDPNTSLFLISDDWGRLQARVKRLKSRNAHIENPHSRTRRFVANVRVAAGEQPGTVRVRANFTVYRIRYEHNDLYVGRYDHVVGWDGETLRFRHRKAVLDLESLRPAGKVSIII
jgi:p-cumate 2,3-dioxygenase beta subunit